MGRGALTGYLDTAQMTLYAFWIFLALLILWLRREDKREGYPLESERSALVKVQGFPPMPPPKTFHLAHGGTRMSPRIEPSSETSETPPEIYRGEPLLPTGDEMLDAVGPAAYANRADVPDQTIEGLPKIVPLRMAEGYRVATEDTNPIGMKVLGADGVVAGTVVDMWVDRSETLIRYVEVEVPRATGPGQVLVPMTLVQLDERRGHVRVHSIMAHQFATAPWTQHPDQVTLREEDRIAAYFASGHLYASPQRLGPIL